MKKITYSLCLYLSVVLLSSCSTDFNTTAPYKEIMVVYGLLNPVDQTQYIRVGKAYLGEGNSIVMAQQKDSINFPRLFPVHHTYKFLSNFYEN